jgi:hypothetical protein
VTIAVLIGAIALLVECLRRNTPWPLTVYAAGVLAMDLGSNGLMNSKARLLLPAFTLLLPVALTLARRRPSTVARVLTTVTLTSAWFGGYALTSWHYAIQPVSARRSSMRSRRWTNSPTSSTSTRVAMIHRIRRFAPERLVCGVV